jgi:hypothetical protein
LFAEMRGGVLPQKIRADLPFAENASAKLAPIHAFKGKAQVIETGISFEGEMRGEGLG